MPKKKITGDAYVLCSIQLMQMLTTAPEHKLSRAAAAASLGIQDDVLSQITDLISLLYDRTTGARATVDITDNEIVLVGDAAELVPLRLTMGDAEILRHILSSLNIDARARERILAALADPVTLTERMELLREPARYGHFYQVLSESIEDGARCEISYRAAHDDSVRMRLIDPHRIIDDGASSYLVAWDINKDAQRLYRMDRISDARLTDDSVERHPFTEVDVLTNLRKNGKLAVLASDDTYARTLSWRGIESISSDGESCLLRVRYTSEPWLFNQVLASLGSLTIEQPEELRERFREYAKTLILPK